MFFSFLFLHRFTPVFAAGGGGVEQAGGQADLQHEEDADQGVHLGAALGHGDQGRGHAQGHLAEEERWVGWTCAGCSAECSAQRSGA